MPKKPTKAEREHMNRVAELGCVACARRYFIYSPAEIHHVRHHGKRCHFRVLPLCFNHHSAQSPISTAVHKNLAQFEKEFGTEKELLKVIEQELNPPHSSTARRD